MRLFDREREIKEARPERHCRVEDRVIVRIWTSGLNQALPGENVGHVSIEVEDSAAYISLWPEQQKKLLRGEVFSTPHALHSYQKDLDEERLHPEIILCLCSLDPERLVSTWAQTKEGLQGWTLVGSNRLINSGSANSCSGLAYDLLKSAGIYDLISRIQFSSTFSAVVTPDDLGKAVAEAKRAELERYPETAGFGFEGETSSERLLGTRANFECVIL